jgi:hypothetical protein
MDDPQLAQLLLLRFRPLGAAFQLGNGLGHHLQLVGGRPVQRNAPRQAVPHGADHVDVARRSAGRETGARRLKGDGLLEVGLDEVRKLQLLEQDVEIFIAAEGEAEIVLALAVGAAFAAAPAATTLRLRQLVAGDELLVAGMDVLAGAALAGMVEARLLDALAGDVDHFLGVDISQRPLFDRADHRFLDVLAHQPDETLPVGVTSAFRVEPPVYNVHTLPLMGTSLSRPCSPAYTTRPGALSAGRCSRG